MKVWDEVFRKAEYCASNQYGRGISFTFDPKVQYTVIETDGCSIRLCGIEGWWTPSCFYLARNVSPTVVENPKTGAGRCKVPLECNPPIASAYQALAHENGQLKYGVRNWRDSEVPLLTYLGAIKRHVDLTLDGEDIDPASGLPHLAHIMAGCAVVLDSKAQGTLKDDRPTAGKANEKFKKIQESLPALRALWAKERGEVQK